MQQVLSDDQPYNRRGSGWRGVVKAVLIVLAAMVSLLAVSVFYPLPAAEVLGAQTIEILRLSTD